MKTPAAVSPFAAKSSQEQKEQWIWWQCQQDATYPEEKAEISDQRSASVPGLKLPQVQEEKQTMRQAVQTVRHSQYDAVVRRMRNATSQVGSYTSLNH